MISTTNRSHPDHRLNICVNNKITPQLYAGPSDFGVSIICIICFDVLSIAYNDQVRFVTFYNGIIL